MQIAKLQERPGAVSCYLVKTLVGGYLYTSREHERLLPVLVRLLDKASDEYTTTRELILAEIREQNITPEQLKAQNNKQYFHFIKVIDHLENCINAINRASNILLTLKAAEFKDFLNGSILKNIRDKIEHIDNDVQNGMKGPTALNIDYESFYFQIGKHKLNIDDIAEFIENLFALWQRLEGNGK